MTSSKAPEEFACLRSSFKMVASDINCNDRCDSTDDSRGVSVSSFELTLSLSGRSVTLSDPFILYYYAVAASGGELATHRRGQVLSATDVEFTTYMDKIVPYRVRTARDAMLYPKPGGIIHKFN